MALYPHPNFYPGAPPAYPAQADPVADITVGPSVTIISRVATKDATVFSFTSDQEYQAYQLRVVPGSGSPVTAGTLIESQVVASDDFSGTNGAAITASTPEVGGPWVKHVSATSGDPVLINNRVRPNSTEGIYYVTGDPDSAEYDVQADLAYLSAVGGVSWGICARMSLVANTYYFAQYWSGDGQLYLTKKVAGGDTHLGNIPLTLSANQTIKLQVRDATKKVFVDGVQKLSSTDNAITGAGKAGVRLYTAVGDATGYHLDNFQVSNTGRAATVARSVTITDDELVAAGATEGTNIVKAFVQSTTGQWSA